MFLSDCHSIASGYRFGQPENLVNFLASNYPSQTEKLVKYASTEKIITVENVWKSEEEIT